MEMVKRVLIVLFVAALCGCNEQNNSSYKFQWAVANKSVLEKEILKVAKAKYPYPDDISMGKSEIREKIGGIYIQIRELRTSLNDKCMMEQKAKEKKVEKKLAAGGMLQNDEDVKAYMRSRNITDLTSTRNRYGCSAKVKSDPLLQELNSRKDKLNAITRKQSEHDRKLRDLSRRYVSKLIGNYSKSKLDMVVDSKSDYILYNSSGVVLDITDVLVSEIDENQLGPFPRGRD